MLTTYTKKQHPKGFYYAFVPFNNDKAFKRLKFWAKEDRFGRTTAYGVYLYIDTSKDGWVILPGGMVIRGKLIYIGRGVYDPNCPLDSRCLNHEDDELAKHLNENVCAFLVGWGMTYAESSALEAYWISTCGLELTKRGKPWLGEGLINKKQERRWIEKGKSILNYGDHIRLIVKR